MEESLVQAGVPDPQQGTQDGGTLKLMVPTWHLSCLCR